MYELFGEEVNDDYIITLNDEQYAAEESIQEWLANTDISDREFILEGRAGTGKTTTIGQIGFQQAIGAAISHKAKEVLFGAFGEKIDCFTIAQILGHEKMNDYSTGKTSFGRSQFSDRKELIQQLKSIAGLIIIVDECSMISSATRKELMMSYPRAKFLYLGDPFQIPPIYKKNDVRKTIFEDQSIPKAHLVKNQRCGDDNPLKSLLNSIVSSQEDNKDHFSKWLGVNKNLNSNKIGYLINTPISEFWTENTFVICFSNAAKRKWNMNVRKNIHGRVASLCIGDRLIFNSNIYVLKDGHQTRIHTNSDIIEVESFENVTLPLSYYTTKNGTVVQDHIDINFFVVNNDKSFYIPTDGGEAVLASIINSTKAAAISATGYHRKKIFREYFKLLNYEAKTSFAYAITAHKSQGSTYERVIVDYNDIMVSTKRFQSLVDRLKLFYVACSRAEKQVLIIK